MSVQEDSLFCSLPVELIFHILRHLDAITIVRSFRLVCKHFHTLANTYGEFTLNFQAILKSDFHYLCNLVRPRNVTSLALSDDDETPGQISYFLSHFRIKQFAQLQYLALFDVGADHLRAILQDVQKLRLTELTIELKEDLALNGPGPDELSTVPSLLSLRKLRLHIPNLNISAIVWPVECAIQHLDIYCGTLDAYCDILYCLPNLRTLTVEGLDTNNLDGLLPELSDMSPASRLTSLTFKYCSIELIILKYFLSLTPTLERLHVIRSVDLRDFHEYLPQWQNFLETKLPSLTTFEFFLTASRHDFDAPIRPEELIAPFRTPFWTETKRWFVNCDYIAHTQTVLLYSTSTYDPQFEFVFQSKQISRLTTTTSTEQKITMEKVRRLSLDLTRVMSLATSSQGGLPNEAVFPKLERLTVRLTDQWPISSLRFLSTLINLSQLTKLTLCFDGPFTYQPDTISNIGLLLKLASNLRSLTVLIVLDHTHTISDYNTNLCSVVPDHVRHLTMSVSTIGQMNMVIGQRKHRSSIKFRYVNHNAPASDVYSKWLRHEREYYSHRIDDNFLSLWFDHRSC